jgi:hypothetical protein
MFADTLRAFYELITVVHIVLRLIQYFCLGTCWVIQRKRFSKYGIVYDAPVVLTLVHATSARMQGAAESTVFCLQTQFPNLMENGCNFNTFLTTMRVDTCNAINNLY